MEKYSFIDLFTKNINGKKINSIVIPKIQRDYAQGRKSAGKVRKDFLNALKNAMNGNGITLDFIYGDINADGKFIPLDGQQRLTTLFLIHWYASIKESINDEECGFLSNFSYETRMSSREFCKALVAKFKPEFESDKLLSSQIRNQTWFPDEWNKDPTIKSMLVMINSIADVFEDVNDMWEKLKSGCINFYVLAIEEMGLTDDIYIKMNSRGRPLTDFENFKAILEQTVGEVDSNLRNILSNKIDNEWTELFWHYRDEDHYIDDKFINFFDFIFDVLCYENHFSKSELPNDRLELINIFYSKRSNFDSSSEKYSKFIKIDPIKSIELMISYFDVIYDIYSCNCNLENYFARFFSETHTEGKVLYDEKEKDLFIDYITRNTEGMVYRKFILLYTFINYELKKSELIGKPFTRKLRIINNLTLNSVNELSDRGPGKNRIPFMLEEVKKIISSGFDNIDLSEDKTGFNSKQLKEEKDKLEWTNQHPEMAETLFRLEDSKYLNGKISVLGLDNYMYFDKFNELFKCNKDKISCALLSIDNYGLKTYHGGKTIYHFGKVDVDDAETTWSKIFRTLDDDSLNRTKRVLVELLQSNENITDGYLDYLISNFLNKCENAKEYDWRYYYIKYAKIRESSYGTYYWKNELNKYDFYVMTTQNNPSEYSYNVFLYVLDNEKLLGSSCFDSLTINGRIIHAYNDRYTVDEKVIYVEQDENGIDKEDRVRKIKDFLNV